MSSSFKVFLVMAILFVIIPVCCMNFDDRNDGSNVSDVKIEQKADSAKSGRKFFDEKSIIISVKK